MSYLLEYSRAYTTSPADAFDRVLAHDLRDLFSARTAAIAPITEVRDQQGEWGTVGQQRRIVLSDGTAMRETLLRVQPPREFGYRIDVVAGTMKFLVRAADGSWAFAADGAGCRITWTWQVDAANAPAALAAPVFRLMWTRNAAKAFDRIGAVLAG